MIAKEYADHLEVKDIRDFELDHIFDCGQCFRWEKNEDGSYTGIAFGKIVTMKYDKETETLKLFGSHKSDFDSVWYDYLDLGRDYGDIKKILADKDDVMRQAVEYGQGIRILNQEKWETLISFIISQNNNIPRIKKCINSLAETLGTKAGEYKGRAYYKLPTPEVLAEASQADLAPCRLGYRAKYLVATAGRIVEEGLESLEVLGGEEICGREALDALLCYCGVGPKVANCIALFSMKKFDSFPIDVWVRKVMNQCYGIDENDMNGMKEYAAEKFGEYGGIAQQYLFYYITHKKK
ncbi:MAG: 8-oxoguanine DNA glycosylase [Clostridiales bacterium]|nr:8-oxoguanine DNA glycosylase [Clostridiales bacterium]